MKNVTVDYILERFRINPNGCNIRPRDENFGFVEYSEGKRVSDLTITPEEAALVMKFYIK